MTENTLVSAFFAIGRENYKAIPRTNNTYVEYFKRWARMQNDLIFFCEDEKFADIVMEIRDSYGLKNKTKTIVLDNITTLCPNIYREMVEIENNKCFLDFRFDSTLPENKAMYNYVMYLKSYCLKEAERYVDKHCKYLSWIDFGFEHGGDKFADENDYNFEWKYDFGDKVTYFYIPPMDERPIFEICRTMQRECMMGMTFVVPKILASKHFESITECYKTMHQVGLMDDDQLFMQFNYNRNKDYIQALPSNWFEPLRDYGSSHFKIKPVPKPLNFFQRCKRKAKHILNKITGKN